MSDTSSSEVQERLEENRAQAALTILTARVEQHLTSVGKTPDALLARSSAAVRNVEKIIRQLKDHERGHEDLDLRSLINELDDEFGPIKARIRWHDQQVVAFQPLRDAMKEIADSKETHRAQHR